ncbi:MAG: colanic acid biosynthesis glycosyltransferase WcaL [Verrucomicrobiales bacterium]|nr:colanic acid biosynthesis glycosyltransferase WcaL [Verrucomicrobiales bacterium]
MELQRQGARLMLFSIRGTDDETVRHFPASLRDQVIHLPPSAALTAEVEAMKKRQELPESAVLTLRQWSGRPDKTRVYEAAWIGRQLQASGVRHVHTHFAGLGARTAWWIRQFYGCSYSFTGHANDLFCPDNATDLKLPRLVADASCVVAVSDYTADWLREHYPESARRIHRVYNGLDLEPIVSATAGVGKAGPPLIVSVGRLIEKKGFGDLIRACAMLRDQGTAFECRIAGGGPLREELEAQIAAAGLTDRVYLEGPRSQEEITVMLGKASVFALPCVTEADGGRDVLPTVLMEAMAAALPCVSTRLAGVPEMVMDHETGLLTAECDPAATAAALTRLLDDPALARRMGLAGLALARERFAQEVTAARLWRLLTAHGKVNGPFPSPALAMARVRQWTRRFSRTLRMPRHGKKAVFPDGPHGRN